MLSKKSDRLTIKGIILTSLLTLLGGCGNSAALESLISADPALKNSQATEVSNQTQTKPEPSESTSAKNTPVAAEKPQPTASQSTDKSTNNQTQPEKRVRKNDTDSGANSDEPQAENSISNLLLNFPETFPVYPQAELQEIQSNEDENSGLLIWTTPDNRQAVADYYQTELLVSGWELIKPFTIRPQQKVARAIAVKEDLRVELSLLQGAKQQDSQARPTKLSVVYHPLDQNIPPSSISQWENSEDEENPAATESLAVAVEAENEQPLNNQTPLESEATPPQTPPQIKTKPQAESQPEPTQPENSYSLSDTDFADLDEVPTQLQQPIESVAALNILTPYTGKANVELTKFAPNEVITRGEYARWLITANNRYYADDPSKKIYVATKTSQSAFNDVKSNHPDFEAIQSLAEAGLIPSRLTEDSTNLLFRPDAPLIREDLVTWKVPLDTRKSLPQASIEAIEESWGFQDAAAIDSSAIRALYADYQNGDRANIRRMFGYTTLFQPKKPVTRAEAAASLWYFGFQGDGITAKEALESVAETES
ncbi:MAG: S-layer homology domain-containing protein [Cyanobacteria bacterium P01_C01_bin.72]